MIQYNSINTFKEIHYNGEDIKYVYDYQGKVWEKESPTPTGGTKFIGEWNNGTSYSAVCDGDATLTSATTRPEGYTLYGMTSAIIGDCITSIGDRVFGNCYNLTSITIPNSVTSIGTYAFALCTSLPSVTIPDSVTSIGSYGFNYCTNLTSVSLSKNLTSIIDALFFQCFSLRSLDVPDSVTNIGANAFYQCSGLTSIDIPSGVTTIGNGAFYKCSSLSSMTINATTPPTLGLDAFTDTHNCPIYVPSASVNAYKTATNWSTYADRIQAIPNS